MNLTIAKLWKEALRSKKYDQSKGGLRNQEGFCCLGVLCDLHRKEHDTTWDRPGSNSKIGYKGNLCYLPEEVMKWTGLKTTDGRIPADLVSLADANDKGDMNFSEIADLIDTYEEEI